MAYVYVILWFYERDGNIHRSNAQSYGIYSKLLERMFKIAPAHFSIVRAANKHL